MICWRCGHETAQGFAVCPQCGTRQQIGSSREPPPDHVPQNRRRVPAMQRYSGGEKAAFITAIVVSIISVIAGLIILMAYGEAQDAKEAQEAANRANYSDVSGSDKTASIQITTTYPDDETTAEAQTAPTRELYHDPTTQTDDDGNIRAAKPSKR